MSDSNPRASRAGSRAGAAWLARPLLMLIRFYQLVISPWLGPRCRFLPTCSEYAADAVALHGPLRGSWLALKRIARCHPWGGSGLDPVPAVRCGCKPRDPADR